MKAKLERKTVDDLLQWKANKMLTANAEYQRGVVWKDPQRKRLIDSVMRGYPIPLIYLHYSCAPPNAPATSGLSSPRDSAAAGN